MNQALQCVNVPIFPNMKTRLFFTLSSKRLSFSPNDTVLEAEAPSSLIASCSHAAKAAEEAVRAMATGDSLRNMKLEFLRRLTARRQIKEVESIIEKSKDDFCYAYVHSVRIETEVNPCHYGEHALELILGDAPELKALGVDGLLSAVALTAIGRWIEHRRF
jgi:hypothetical protein